MASRYCYKDVMPFIAMVAVQASNVGVNILFKAATLKGMSYYIFITYSNVIGALLLLPFCFVFPRFFFLRSSIFIHMIYQNHWQFALIWCVSLFISGYIAVKQCFPNWSSIFFRKFSFLGFLGIFEVLCTLISFKFFWFLELRLRW